MKKKKQSVSTVLISVITILLMLISLFPYYYMVLQSFLPWELVDKALLPEKVSLDSYIYLLGGNGAGSTDPWQWIRALAICGNAYEVQGKAGNLFLPAVSDVLPGYYTAGSQIYADSSAGKQLSGHAASLSNINLGNLHVYQLF